MNDDFQPLVFDNIDLREVPVTIAGQAYVLKAADGDVACQYKNMAASLYRLNQDTKETVIKGAGDLEPFLVSLCLYKVISESEKQKVHITHVKKLPPPVIKKLFDTAKKIGGLDEDVSLEALKKQKAEIEKQIAEKEADLAKNGQSPTTDG